MADKVIVNGFTEGGHYLVRSVSREGYNSSGIQEAWCLKTTPKLFIQLKIRRPTSTCDDEVWLDSRFLSLEIVEELA